MKIYADDCHCTLVWSVSPQPSSSCWDAVSPTQPDRDGNIAEWGMGGWGSVMQSEME